MGWVRGRGVAAVAVVAVIGSFVATTAAVPAAGAATFDVTSGADDGSPGTLRWAVAQAGSASGDDLVSIDPAVTAITLTDCVAGRVDVGGSGALTIAGNGATVTQTCDSSVFGTDGAATLILRDLVVTGGDAVNGGGIDVPNGSVTLERVTLTQNRADEIGGGVRASTLQITDSSVTENAANTGAGVAGSGGGTVDITGSTITDNHAFFTGFPFPEMAAPHARGGAVAVLGAGLARISATSIHDNSAPMGGGGVYSAADLTLDDVVVADNVAPGYNWVMGSVGGGVLTDAGSLVVRTSEIRGNLATFGGGFNGNGTVEVHDSTIEGNVGVQGYGGGWAPSLLVTRSSVSFNANATGPAGGLGASQLTVVDSAIVGNQSGGFGGGLVSQLDGLVRNTTIVGNVGPSGPAIYSTGELRLELSTVDGNVGETAPTSGTARVFGTAFGAGACAGLGPISSEGFNVAADGGCGMADPTDLVDVGDLVLGPLGLNDGPTPNQVPQSGSPLLNRISADHARCTGADQRGFGRPQNGACDAGSVEVRAVSAVGTTVTSAGAAPIDVDLHPLVIDPDGVLAVYEVDDVVGGIADGNDLGVVTYTPQPGFDGSGRFAFVVCSLGDVICTNAATVTVTGPAVPVTVNPRFTG